MKKAVLLLAVIASAQSNNDTMAKADVERDMRELSNWGRWRKDDQLGAANQGRRQRFTLARVPH
jgi:hypothetical protein